MVWVNCIWQNLKSKNRSKFAFSKISQWEDTPCVKTLSTQTHTHPDTHVFAQRKTKLLQTRRQQYFSTKTQLHDLSFLSWPTPLVFFFFFFVWESLLPAQPMRWWWKQIDKTPAAGKLKVGVFFCYFFCELLWLMKTFLHVKLKPLRETHRSGTIVHLLHLQQIIAHLCTGAQQQLEISAKPRHGRTNYRYGAYDF